MTESFDEYNFRLGGEVHHSLRAGTPQSTGVMHSVPATLFYESGPGFVKECASSGVIRAEGENRPSRPTHTVVQEASAQTDSVIVRRLSPTECERLMGWPDGYTLCGLDDEGNQITLGKSARYRICGNGIVAPITEWIGKRISAVIEP